MKRVLEVTGGHVAMAARWRCRKRKREKVFFKQEDNVGYFRHGTSVERFDFWRGEARATETIERVYVFLINLPFFYIPRLYHVYLIGIPWRMLRISSCRGLGNSALHDR